MPGDCGGDGRWRASDWGGGYLGPSSGLRASCYASQGPTHMQSSWASNLVSICSLLVPSRAEVTPIWRFTRAHWGS